jgi:hypothetical protein
MVEERYIRIENGKVIPTGNVMTVSPQAILDRPAPLWECSAAKEALQMEADGLMTIEDGGFKLTKKGIEQARTLRDHGTEDES